MSSYSESKTGQIFPQWEQKTKTSWY